MCKFGGVKEPLTTDPMWKADLFHLFSEGLSKLWHLSPHPAHAEPCTGSQSLSLSLNKVSEGHHGYIYTEGQKP